MRAMLLRGTVSMKGNSNPLEPAELPPRTGGERNLVKISACGVAIRN